MMRDSYKNIGKLFYAIAATDKAIRTEEYLVLKNSIKKDWIKIDSIEGVQLILQTFIVLKSDNALAEKCFVEFETYYNSNKELFSANLKNRILTTSGLVASSFSSKNKSELILLAKLDILFKN